MTTPSPRSPASLPASSELAIDQVCNAFEDAWKAGLQPSIEDYLGRVSELARPALIRELVAIEFQYRWSAAETLSPQSYLRRFPALDPDWLASLAAAPGASLRLERTAASEPRTLTQASSEALPGRRVVFPTQVLGDYELLEEISHGGMGVVYRARQVSLNRIVAVKLIRSGDLASDDEFQRFQFEAEAAANLDHPHIVPVYEVGTENGLRYLAMKLIEGGNLSQRMSDFTLAEMDQRTLPESANRASGKEESAARQQGMARLLISVARAVHYAHQRGILHRDLKPSNILLDRDDTPFVSDFGLAKRVDAMNSDEQEQLTRTGVIVGTPSYMSPEQARGVKALTTAADVYALGAILYHLITGEPPFRAPTALDIIHKVITEEVRPPRQLQPRVAVDLETICLKCLRKDPPATRARRSWPATWNGSSGASRSRPGPSRPGRSRGAGCAGTGPWRA